MILRGTSCISVLWLSACTGIQGDHLAVQRVQQPLGRLEVTTRALLSSEMARPSEGKATAARLLAGEVASAGRVAANAKELLGRQAEHDLGAARRIADRTSSLAAGELARLSALRTELGAPRTLASAERAAGQVTQAVHAVPRVLGLSRPILPVPEDHETATTGKPLVRAPSPLERLLWRLWL